ncbi:hypothetical protein M8818_003255 [Zalaria obscura]|uniref:Uncharacterized protein n=1 Tax=Zalaria obscura TaxID=2024903 RepID=A0ACC3SIK2_9PEZI
MPDAWSFVNKKIASTVGLASEAVHYHREKAAERKAALSPNTSNGIPEIKEPTVTEGEYFPEQHDDEAEGDEAEDNDEEDWRLDEAIAPPDYETAVAEDENAAQEDEPLPTLPAPGERYMLPYPVVMPQRRPGTKERGFIRAYAPDLAHCGIDEASFMQFLKQLQTANNVSKVIAALYIGGGIVGTVPSVITLAVSISVQTAARIAGEAETRYKTNNFLDRANREIFMPRGLYAMIVRYKPDELDRGIGMETVDARTTKTIAKYSQDPDASTEGIFKARNYRIASGVNVGESSMPAVCAPLIFPGLTTSSPTTDTATPTSPLSPTVSAASPVATSSPQSERQKKTLKEKARASRRFINEYYDRRAQALYAAKHPDTMLATQAEMPKFRSRYADPNHPASNGHLFNLLTGGRAKAQGLGYAARERRRLELLEENKERIRQGLKPKETLIGGVKRKLQLGVLYLTIVNMPSEEELEAAKKQLESQD